MKVMILGASGMVGHQVLKACLERTLEVCGVLRSRQAVGYFTNGRSGCSIQEINDIRKIPALEQIIRKEKPDYLVNAVGIVVQLPLSRNYYESVSINALLPHQLEKLGSRYGFRLIQVSTDCVFNGRKGMYTESDTPDAEDLYGKTKELGEVGYGCGITLRTSLIGQEIVKPVHGLLEWFLAQEREVNGYTKAIFSGLTTMEFARVLLDVVIPSQLPAGIYHLAGETISKFDLLQLIKEAYNKPIHIQPSTKLIVDRSLDGSLFNRLTGYQPPSWPDMIQTLYQSRVTRYGSRITK
jgi:dTDP-4-dehydrorhamnose reductase